MTSTFEISLSNYTVATFTTSEQAAFISQIISYLRLSSSQVSVSLTNIRDGSIIFNTIVTLINGDATAAAALLATIQQVSFVLANAVPNVPLLAVSQRLKMVRVA